MSTSDDETETLNNLPEDIKDDKLRIGLNRLIKIDLELWKQLGLHEESNTNTNMCISRRFYIDYEICHDFVALRNLNVSSTHIFQTCEHRIYKERIYCEEIGKLKEYKSIIPEPTEKYLKLEKDIDLLRFSILTWKQYKLTNETKMTKEDFVKMQKKWNSVVQNPEHKIDMENFVYDNQEVLEEIESESIPTKEQVNHKENKFPVYTVGFVGLLIFYLLALCEYFYRTI